MLKILGREDGATNDVTRRNEWKGPGCDGFAVVVLGLQVWSFHGRKDLSVSLSSQEHLLSFLVEGIE